MLGLTLTSLIRHTHLYRQTEGAFIESWLRSPEWKKHDSRQSQRMKELTSLDGQNTLKFSLQPLPR